MYSSTHTQLWCYEGVDGQCCALAAISPGKRCLTHCTGSWVGLEMVWKISPTMGFEPLTFQPVVSHYTNYIIPATQRFLTGGPISWKVPQKLFSVLIWRRITHYNATLNVTIDLVATCFCDHFFAHPSLFIRYFSVFSPAPHGKCWNITFKLAIIISTVSQFMNNYYLPIPCYLHVELQKYSWCFPKM
jgi:hypothetical protein